MEKYEFIELLNKSCIDEDTKEVEGISVSVCQSTDRFSTTVSQTLDAFDIGYFKREGRKEISYENWVDTFWNDWEEYSG